MAISGTERIRLAPLSAALHTIRHTPRVHVHFGAPVTVQALGHGRARREASDRLMRAIVEMLPRAYHGVYAADEPLR